MGKSLNPLKRHKQFQKKYGPFGSKGVDPFSAHRGLEKWDQRNAMKTRDALGWGDDGQTDADRRAMVDAMRGNRSDYNTTYVPRTKYRDQSEMPGYQRPPRNYVNPRTREQFQRPYPPQGQGQGGPWGNLRGQVRGNKGGRQGKSVPGGRPSPYGGSNPNAPGGALGGSAQTGGFMGGANVPGRPQMMEATTRQPTNTSQGSGGYKMLTGGPGRPPAPMNTQQMMATVAALRGAGG